MGLKWLTNSLGGLILNSGALAGVKVIDLTHHIAGPYATKLLADFGADVLKVERPGGDPARRLPPFYHDQPDAEKSLPFLYLNTNKRSITLNLKSETGRSILMDLLADADAVVENFSPRVMPSLGLDAETLRQHNTKLVVASVSNFGQSGSWRDFRATEIVEYALGGLMYIFGAYDREPLKHALHQAQFKAGTNLASATLMALYHQRLTGQGQRVDVSIQESIASALRDVTNNYTYTGAVRRRQPNHTGDLTRLRAVSDGYVLPNPGMGATLDWKVLVDFLEAPELDDERFDNASARLENAEALGEILDQIFATKHKEEIFYAAHQKRFIYGVIDSPEETLDNPQIQARGYYVPVQHPDLGEITFPGAPFLMSGSPWAVTDAAPRLGEHTGAVLGDMGYSAQELAWLRASEVI
jgi:crotonobetainyl-CoA:carnitine CoA-transferase CaiB-like acyl-CoA transferase